MTQPSQKNSKIAKLGNTDGQNQEDNITQNLITQRQQKQNLIVLILLKCCLLKLATQALFPPPFLLTNSTADPFSVILHNTRARQTCVFRPRQALSEAVLQVGMQRSEK